MNLLIDLFIAILIFAGAFCIGDTITKRAFPGLFTPFESFLIATGTGLAFISYLTFLLGVAGLLYQWIFIVLLAVFLCFSVIRMRSLWRDSSPDRFRDSIQKIRSLISQYRFIERFACAAILVSILFTLIFSYAPPTSEDELMYHLAFPKSYVEAHRITNSMPEEIMSYYPQTTEMLYTVAMLVRSDRTAKLINYLLGLLLLLSVLYLGSTYFDMKTALLSACIFYTSPFCTQLSGVALVDLALGFYGLLCIMAILAWIKSDFSPGLLVLAGFMSGMCISVKYPGISFVILCVVVLLWYQIKRKTHPLLVLKEWIMLGIPICLIFLPWIVRNLFMTGNLFTPINMIATRPNFRTAHILSKPIMSILFDFFKALRDLFIGGSTLTPGALFAFVPLFIFIKKRPKIIHVIAALCMIHLVASYALGFTRPRFFTATYLLFSLIAVFTIAELMKIKTFSKFLCILFVMAIIFPNMLFNIYLGGKRIPVFTGMQSREDYLRKEYDGREGYETVEFCNNHLGRENIFVLTRDFVLPYYYKNRLVTNNTTTFLGMSDIKAVLSHLRQEGVGYFMFCKEGFIEKNGAFINASWPSLRLNWFTQEHKERYFDLIYDRNDVVIYRIQYEDTGNRNRSRYL
ncbi:MAG: ArnT family glycosyltransferase [bacterium]